ncbi:MAG: hypothetical protein HYZ27_01875, partial [Deltaproteobacteria bacterium]|nr:hypothetical protein [Deltaproteobacteria bacterium]
PNMFTSYSAKKVQALFDRLYLKPTDAIGQYKTQDVYDVFFKPTVTNFAQDVAFISASVPKARLNKLLKEYQTAAKEKSDAFSGPDFLYQLAQDNLSLEGAPNSVRNGRTLGIMLRRRADKTWPTVTKLLKRVLKDYDPALSKELAGKL